MQIDKRNRSELKQYFVKNAIPTESNFAELIDGMLNQRDDGIAKPPNDALSIEAAGDPTSQKKAIHFYASFSDTDPAWAISLNPRQNPANAATARPGFSISDGAGNSRLFVDRATGWVGVGTVGPLQAALHVDRGATNDLALMLTSSGPGWGSGLQLRNTAPGAAKTFGIYAGFGSLHFADVDASVDRMVITKGGDVSFSGQVGIGVGSPVSDLSLRRDVAGALGPVLTFVNALGSPGAGGAIDFNGYNVGANPPTLRIQSLDDGNYSSHLAIYTKVSGGAGNALVERLRVSSNGNVGIRSTSPLSTLSVSGPNASLRITSGNENGYVFENDNADNYKLKLRYKNPSNVYKEIMSFDYATGNVGLGTTAPRGRLDVAAGESWITKTLHISAPSDGTDASVLDLHNETTKKLWHITLRANEAEKLIFWRNDATANPWLAVLKLGMTGVVEAPGGALVQSIGIGTQSHGATTYPYETIQMNPGHNLRVWFGAKERFMFSNSGEFTIRFDQGFWVFQNDGNLVKYDNNRKAIWALNLVSGHPGWT